MDIDDDSKPKRAKIVDTSVVDGDHDVTTLRSKYHQLIEEKFLFQMPDDFYSIWQFAVSIDRDNPIGMPCLLNSNEHELSYIYLDAFIRAKQTKLVGAFNVLANRIDITNVSIDDCINRDRFAFDPPELQTLIVFDGGHYGYWRYIMCFEQCLCLISIL